jgi:hypothetical protein
MASVKGATCAMCIKSPAIIAKCSSGDYHAYGAKALAIARMFGLESGRVSRRFVLIEKRFMKNRLRKKFGFGAGAQSA